MDNLPPGVSVSDIPGNRPEDLEWEEFHEWIDKLVERNNFSIDTMRNAIYIGLNVIEKSGEV
jgi:hypothetical protein